MAELKTYIVMVIGALFTLLAPIQNFMIAMALLFSVNFVFGLLADIVNKNPWSWKKALWFFVLCFIFFGTVGALFLIGHFMDEKEQAVVVVKGLCFLAVYVFGTNIARNWRNILIPGTAWYRFVDLMYYVLSVKFVEKFSIVKKWQEERQNNGTTIKENCQA